MEIDKTVQMEDGAQVDKTVVVKSDDTVHCRHAEQDHQDLDEDITIVSRPNNTLVSLLGETIHAFTGHFEEDTSSFFEGMPEYDIEKIVSPKDLDDAKELNCVEGQNKNYVYQKKIAEGGQGSINIAVDKQFQRVVAVKSLLDNLKENDAIRTAFINEAKITGQLDHPSIVPVYSLY